MPRPVTGLTDPGSGFVPTSLQLLKTLRSTWRLNIHCKTEPLNGTHSVNYTKYDMKTAKIFQNSGSKSAT